MSTSEKKNNSMEKSWVLERKIIIARWHNNFTHPPEPGVAPATPQSGTNTDQVNGPWSLALLQRHVVFEFAFG